RRSSVFCRMPCQNPTQEQAPRDIYGGSSEDYGPIVSFIMRLSQGAIQNARQVNYILITAAVVMLIVSVLILMFSGTPQGESREHLFPPGSSALAPEPIK
ncbi:MAG: hypothetical protein AAB972_02595, partial [Patescibacteria group bacterium]